MTLDKKLLWLRINLTRFIEIKAMTCPYDDITDRSIDDLDGVLFEFRAEDYQAMLRRKKSHGLSLEMLEVLRTHPRCTKYSVMIERLYKQVEAET